MRAGKIIVESGEKFKAISEELRLETEA